jgi:hypothetical protein
MACDHLGGPEVIEMTEHLLRERKVDERNWTGIRARHGENLTGGMWASVVIEIERRGDEWVVTRLDRRSESLPESETGLHLF